MERVKMIFLLMGILIFIALILTFIQASYLVNRTVVTDPPCPRQPRQVISLSDFDISATLPTAERFPYVAAVTRNSANLWPFACFASVILFKWIVTSAHCKGITSSHRVILFHDFVHNQSYTFSIIYWRIHQNFSSETSPKYDIALARLELRSYPFAIKPSDFDDTEASGLEACVWKTISTMDNKQYLTNDFEKYDVKIANADKCEKTYGIDLDESMLCVDTSDYDDCFMYEFGPIYSRDKLVGVMAMKPTDCDVKYSIFTNVSFYTSWILRTMNGR